MQVGKIGCFISGCCYGIKYNGPLNITYKYSQSAPKDISLFPVQIIETIVFILIFILIAILIKKIKDKNKIIGSTLILCSISKFTLDFFRMDHTNITISLNQIISIIFLLSGLFIIFLKKNYIKIKNANIYI